METPENKSNGIAPAVGVGLVIVGALSLLSRFVPGIGTFMWASAFMGGGAFTYYQYTKDRSRWWLLIPAYGMTALSGLIYLDMLRYLLEPLRVADGLVPAYIFAAMAVPFGWAYREKKIPLPVALIGAPFALMSAGFLLSAIGPIIPAILIIVGLFLILRQSGVKLPGTTTAAAHPSMPAPVKELPPKRIEPIFEPLNIPTPVAAKPTSGPAADK